MNKYVLIIFLTLCFSKSLIAQPQFVDDLDKDFRYKVEGTNLEDRGQELFKKDVEKELNKSPLFKKNTESLEEVNFMINFSDKIIIDHLGIYDINRKIAIENRSQKIDRLAEILDKLKPHWRPAEYQGEIYDKGRVNSVKFNIYCDDNGIVSIVGMLFSESKQRYKLDSSCFKTIDPISKYENPLFYSTEISAQYNGGEKMLKSNLNALLKPTKVEKPLIDYFTMDFAILKGKRLAYFNTYNPLDEVEALVSGKIKLLSCNWLYALQGSNQVNVVLSYKFYYSYTLDENQQRVNIRILDIITQDVPLKTRIEKDF